MQRVLHYIHLPNYTVLLHSGIERGVHTRGIEVHPVCVAQRSLLRFAETQAKEMESESLRASFRLASAGVKWPALGALQEVLMQLAQCVIEYYDDEKRR